MLNAFNCNKWKKLMKSNHRSEILFTILRFNNLFAAEKVLLKTHNYSVFLEKESRRAHCPYR